MECTFTWTVYRFLTGEHVLKCVHRDPAHFCGSSFPGETRYSHFPPRPPRRSGRALYFSPQSTEQISLHPPPSLPRPLFSQSDPVLDLPMLPSERIFCPTVTPHMHPKRLLSSLSPSEPIGDPVSLGAASCARHSVRPASFSLFIPAGHSDSPFQHRSDFDSVSSFLMAIEEHVPFSHLSSLILSERSVPQLLFPHPTICQDLLKHCFPLSPSCFV